MNADAYGSDTYIGRDGRRRRVSNCPDCSGAGSYIMHAPEDRGREPYRVERKRKAHAGDFVQACKRCGGTGHVGMVL